MTGSTRPVPVPDPQSAGFWAAAAEHRLAVQRCDACGAAALPPADVCPRCLSTPPSFRWTPVEGRGTVRTWTVVHHAFLPAFEAELPYVLADVELVDEPEIVVTARLADVDEPRVGLAVRVAFEAVTPEVSVPYFTADDAADREATER